MFLIKRTSFKSGKVDDKTKTGRPARFRLAQRCWSGWGHQIDREVKIVEEALKVNFRGAYKIFMKYWDTKRFLLGDFGAVRTGFIFLT